MGITKIRHELNPPIDHIDMDTSGGTAEEL
jgi:hypothetical protein